jgi:hypothetical protein
MEHLEPVIQFLKQYGSVIALLLTWGGIAVVYVRKRADWVRKSFMGQVNFSLNFVENNTLLLRTLMEEPANDVWLNDYGVKQVLRAAERVTLEQPFLIMDDDEDMDFVKRAVLNVLSERFAEAFVARSLGVPVKAGTYIFGITFEKYADLRTRKLRVLLMEESLLKSLFGPENKGANLAVVNPIHQDRISSLRVMHQLLAQQQSSTKTLHPLGRLELGVVV